MQDVVSASEVNETDNFNFSLHENDTEMLSETDFEDIFSFDTVKEELASDLLRLKSQFGVTDVAISEVVALMTKQCVEAFERFEIALKVKAKLVFKDEHQVYSWNFFLLSCYQLNCKY